MIRKPIPIVHKILELLEKMQRDLRAAEQVRRRQKEISKNPHFGRKQAFSYLLTVCAEHENTVREFWEILQLLQERIDAKLNKASFASNYNFYKKFPPTLGAYDQNFLEISCHALF